MDTKSMKKVLGLAGITVSSGAKVANHLARMGFDVTDSMLSTANSLAKEFSGSGMGTPILDSTKKVANQASKGIDKSAAWLYKKSKELTH